MSTCTLSWTEWQTHLQKVKHNQFYSKWDVYWVSFNIRLCVSAPSSLLRTPYSPSPLLSLLHSSPSPISLPHLPLPPPPFPLPPFPLPQNGENNCCRNQPFQLVLGVWSSLLFLSYSVFLELIINPVVLLKVAWNKEWFQWKGIHHNNYNNINWQQEKVTIQVQRSNGFHGNPCLCQAFHGNLQHPKCMCY